MDDILSPDRSAGRIAALMPPVISTLRSSIIITSLAQAVTELVQNALDARARQIAVVLDLERWGVRVHDDGTGMTRQAVESIGKGHRYGTSKTIQRSSLTLQSAFGYRGEALASLASIASLEIASCTKDSPTSWSSSIKGSRPISSGPSTTHRRTKPGTTVVLKDLFYNLPVRRSSHPSPASTLSACRKVLETASMLFPEVSFSLIDRAREREPAGGRIWSVLKTSSVIARFSELHGPSLAQTITPIELWERPDNIDHEGEMRLNGFISLQGAHTRSYQYLYVNHHPLAWCELHRAIEARFDRSGFARAAHRDTSPSSPSGSRRSPRRFDRKPVYVLNLSVPPRKLDLNLDPAKTAAHFEDWAAVTTLLVSAVDVFLEQHGLSVAPSSVTRRLWSEADRGSPSPSPTKRPRTVKGRVDAIRADAHVSFVVDPASEGPATLTRWQDPLTQEVFLIDPRTGHSFSAETKRTGGDTTDDAEDSPRASGRHRRSFRPSECYDEQGQMDENEAPSWLHTTLTDWRNPIFASRLEAAIPSVAPNLPSTGFGPVSTDVSAFATSIPTGLAPPMAKDLFRNPSTSAFKSAINYVAYAQSGSTPSDPLASSQFSKESLLSARVVAQVDRKFIACVLPGGSSTSTSGQPVDGSNFRQGDTLALIDQHAADERIRVERFLREIGDGFLSSGSPSGGVRQSPTPSLLLLLTPAEHGQLVDDPALLKVFARWGIQLRLPDLLSGSPSSAPVQIHVDAVPTLLIDRLEGKKTKGEAESGVGREAPRELSELVKSYLARLMSADEGRELEAIFRVRTTGSGGDEWLGALRFCPREMLDLINSKACRGAIMFNDPLTLTQCTKLVADLSKTVAPFQCAHGRPSTVPLIDLEDLVASRKLKPSSRRRRPLDWEGLGLDS